MKKIILTLFVGLFISVSPVVAQVQNQQNQPQLQHRLPRKAIINAAQRTLQDTISGPAKLLVCNPQTSSITIEVCDMPNEKVLPYTITLDTLGVTLEIFSGTACVYSDFFEYKGSNFAKVQAKANASKLKRVKLHKDSLSLSETVTINFNTTTESYFMVYCSGGMTNYAGDFLGFVTYAKSLIPNFETIINSEYLNPMDYIDGSVFVNGVKDVWRTVNEIKGIIAIETDSIAHSLDKNISNITLQTEISNIEAQQLKLIRVSHYYDKKKKIDLSGFTYEDLVKTSLLPSLVKNTNNGIATIEFDLKSVEVGIYCIYNAHTNKIVVIEIKDSSNVG